MTKDAVILMKGFISVKKMGEFLFMVLLCTSIENNIKQEVIENYEVAIVRSDNPDERCYYIKMPLADSRVGRAFGPPAPPKIKGGSLWIVT